MTDFKLYGSSNTYPESSSGRTLGAGQTRAFSYEEIATKYGQVETSLVADQDCALSVQFSADAVNWNHSYDYQVPANTGFHKAVLPKGRFMHLEVTNQGVH